MKHKIVKTKWHSLLTLAVSPKGNWSMENARDLLLSPFLDWLRFEGVSYAWTGKINQKGHIYFRVSISSSISWLRIREQWNQLQARHHLIIPLNGYLGPVSTDIQIIKESDRFRSYWVVHTDNCNDEASGA